MASAIKSATESTLAGRAIMSSAFADSLDGAVTSFIPQDSKAWGELGSEIGQEVVTDALTKSLTRSTKHDFAKALAKSSAMRLLNRTSAQGVKIGSSLAAKITANIAVKLTSQLASKAMSWGANLAGGPIGLALTVLDIGLAGLTIGLDLTDPTGLNKQLDLKTLMKYRYEILEELQQDYQNVKVIDPLTNRRYRGSEIPNHLGGPSIYPYEIYPFYVPWEDPLATDEFYDLVIEYLQEQDALDDGSPELTPEQINLTSQDRDILTSYSQIESILSQGKKEKKVTQNKLLWVVIVIAVIVFIMSSILLVYVAI